jgi:hypothetical protein
MMSVAQGWSREIAFIDLGFSFEHVVVCILFERAVPTRNQVGNTPYPAAYWRGVGHHL